MIHNGILTTNPTLKAYTVAAIIHTALLVLIFSILNHFGIIKYSILDLGYQWDAKWYWSIVSDGYSYSPDQKSNVAYYPLFPWLWKFIQISPLGISIMNWTISLAGVFILGKALNIPLSRVYIFLSFPSIIFFMVPYSESIFLFGGSLILIGLHKNQLSLILIGVILACLTRSIGSILSLCFLFTYLLNIKKSLSLLDHLKSLLPIAVSLTINAVVQSYQFYETGVQFNYLEVQAQWGRVIDLPSLPLTTRPFPSTMWTDYLALFIGIFSGAYILRSAFNKISNTTFEINNATLFSLLYLAGVTCVTLLFSGKYVSGNTVIASLNRFVFATPFLLIFLNEMLNRAKQSNKRKALYSIQGVSIVVWLLISIGFDNSNFNLKWQLYFLLTLTFPFVYYLVLIRPKFKLWLPLYLAGTIIQAYFLGLFIAESWIG